MLNNKINSQAPKQMEMQNSCELGTELGAGSSCLALAWSMFPSLYQSSAWLSSHQQCWAEQQSWGVLMQALSLSSFSSHQTATRDLNLWPLKPAFPTHP